MGLSEYSGRARTTWRSLRRINHCVCQAPPYHLWRHSSAPESLFEVAQWTVLASVIRPVKIPELEETHASKWNFTDNFARLMGQDEIYLQVIATSGEAHERRNAKKVLALLKRGKHWVLVTLLLGNVITNETLPIVLDRSLGGGWPAVLGSTVLIGKATEPHIPTRLFGIGGGLQ
jgi:hypothetical protein